MNDYLRALFLSGIAVSLLACSSDMDTAGDASTTSGEEEMERGPNNGRLLGDDGFVVELAIFETGVPPEFRAWVTQAGQSVDPSEIDLSVELTRLGNVVDRHNFTVQDGYLRGDAVVYEPHSFVVSVTARHRGRSYQWEYESFEGRTRIGAEMAEAFGLETMIAGPALLAESVTAYGTIVPDVGRVREVSARFDGAIEAVNVALGELVQRGQPMARVESNESLQVYTINAPIDGVVTERVANAGEQTAGRRLFTIVDLASVWAELAIFPSDRSRVRVGAKVTIAAATGGLEAQGTIAQIMSVAGANQAVTARVVLDNADDRWALGTYVTGTIEVAEYEVPLAVKRSALQSFRDFTVVYAQVGDEYEVRMLELGREAGDWVEVLGGLAPGTVYVTENSYVLKADVEKSGASHDH